MLGMEYADIRHELVEVSRMIAGKGYTQASGGNVSCRIPRSGLFAIKRTATNMDRMICDDVLIVDEQGTVVEGEGVPSKEVNFHLGIMKLRQDVGAVVHCHPCFAIGFANCGMEMPHTTVTSRKVVGRIPCVESAPAGSAELCAHVLDAFRADPGIKGILMKQHGICTVGPTLIAAYNIADLVEQTCRQAYIMQKIDENREFFNALRF